VQLKRRLLIIVAGIVMCASVGKATEPAGIESNVLLAQGSTLRSLKEHIQVGNDWMVSLEDKGQSDFYFQEVVTRPGGRSGWHSHPGILLIAVKEGTIDWYDKGCEKHTYTAGQSFTEGAEPHNVVNSGSVNSRLLIMYVVKRGEPRRLESPQPRCGEPLQVR
jgi:quercetin dioxygenase-like cupin family protein